ncbi:MAG: rRNA pseudouridine synthase [Gemmatimonadetes bacterium]|nr:rRNA pseudouridine synthase [Gemmatimonadota bacterium]
MRLQKFLARAGVASRRKSETLIADGRVRVDGRVVTELGTRVDPARANVEVDGRAVALRPADWIALHKPPGYACTRDDPEGRPTVYELLDPEARHLFHVGRLDFLSQGLLLLSNDGDVAHALLHPSTELVRRYEVEVTGPGAVDLPARLEAGIRLEDGLARAREARWLTPPEGPRPTLEIGLTEGRNREIRRMLADVGVGIRVLERVAFGPIALGDLPPGATRPLTESEKTALREASTGCSSEAGS